ncbi:hypothetical protein PFISCL1PPCAC_13911 [Pristionchus fissidentatus]|uniref:Nuclear receptor domain-containing protein n=1 Tax=Pristionchus fissidentatus TaxID=1538716 RepID=A0AAV5VY15_9BILA|nr:hypothetical protein PFISCL1PPCAC_13911 [Pristionchus fissidentatus]
MAVDCLVCGKPTNATHMGMDACRACTVFYRRNRGARDKLTCINGNRSCVDYRKGIYTCRRCRLDRFETVMRAGRHDLAEPSHLTPSPASTSSTPSASPTEDAFAIDFSHLQGPSREVFTPPLTPDSSIIERIRASYKRLSIVRRTAELQLRGIFLEPFEAEREEYEIAPCTYQIMNETTRILITALFDFIPAIFPEFNSLSIADKWLLVRNYQKIFHCLDSTMRMTRHFGTSPEKCFGSYTTYLSKDKAEFYFSDCHDQQNVSQAAR